MVQIVLRKIAPRRHPLYAAALLVDFLGARTRLQQPELGLDFVNAGELLRDSACQIGNFQLDDECGGRNPVAFVKMDCLDEAGNGGTQLGASSRANLERASGTVFDVDKTQ